VAAQCEIAARHRQGDVHDNRKNIVCVVSSQRLRGYRLGVMVSTQLGSRRRSGRACLTRGLSGLISHRFYPWSMWPRRVLGAADALGAIPLLIAVRRPSGHTPPSKDAPEYETRQCIARREPRRVDVLPRRLLDPGRRAVRRRENRELRATARQHAEKVPEAAAAAR